MMAPTYCRPSVRSCSACRIDRTSNTACDGSTRTQGCARLGHERRRVAGRPDGERNVAGRRLSEGSIQRRIVAAPEPVVDDVAGDTDDRQPRPRAGSDALSDRIGAGPVFPRERLGDDRDRLAVLSVRVGERPSRPDWDLERREELWRGGPDSRPRAGWLGSGFGTPSISIDRPELLSAEGMTLMAAAASTPGTVAQALDDSVGKPAVVIGRPDSARSATAAASSAGHRG